MATSSVSFGGRRALPRLQTHSPRAHSRVHIGAKPTHTSAESYGGPHPYGGGTAPAHGAVSARMCASRTISATPDTTRIVSAMAGSRPGPRQGDTRWSTDELASSRSHRALRVYH